MKKAIAKNIVLLILALLALVVCVLNILKITDSTMTAPLIWIVFSVVNISNTVSFFKDGNKKSGAFYAFMSVLSLAVLVQTIIDYRTL